MNRQATTPPNKKRLRAAIIGFGVSGELSHAYGLKGTPAFEIVAVCDLSKARREKAEQMLGCATFASHTELLESSLDLDLAAIVTRSDIHCEMATDSLKAGVNVLITKPWVLDTSEAEQLLNVQQQTGKEIFPWIPMYWSPEYEKIKKLIDSNAIGKVFTIRRYITQFQKRSDWQTEARYGGGYLLNWGAHIVQPVLALAQSTVESVMGNLRQVINPGDVEDNFHVMLQFENGIQGIAEYAQAIEGLPSFMIQGTGGTILSDGNEITLLTKDPSELSEPKRSVFAIAGKRFGDEVDIYRDVARTLVEGTRFRASTADALIGTSVIDATKRSNLSNRAERPTFTSFQQTP